MQANFDQIAGAQCVVTGGAGFIGSHLVTRLVELGCDVTVVDNLSTGFESNLEPVASNIRFVKGDVSDQKVVSASVKSADYVFHHAAMASVPRSMREPALCHAWCATSTVNILQAAAGSGVKRVLLASTSAVYGNSPFVAKRESDKPAPMSPYAAAKLASEQYCEAFYRGFGLETVCLRYFNVFGPRQDPQSEYSAVIPRFVAMILSGQQPIIYGDGYQSRDFVYVGDVVRANLMAATTPGVGGNVFNVARGSSVTLIDLLDQLRQLLNQAIDPIHQPPRDGDVRDSLADISLARSVLGYEPSVAMEIGLRESIDYYKGLVATA
jgi:nucleoside-diphosphate-sugar epimerase